MNDKNETQELTTMEATARQRAIRLREEKAGRDPMQCEEYLEARALVAELCGNDVDNFKRSRYGFELAENDRGRE